MKRTLLAVGAAVRRGETIDGAGRAAGAQVVAGPGGLEVVDREDREDREDRGDRGDRGDRVEMLLLEASNLKAKRNQNDGTDSKTS